MPSPMVAFRASRDLAPLLAARGESMSAVAYRDLQRYYDSLESALRALTLTEPDWNFLRAILNGTICDERTAQHLWAEVEDADPQVAAAWGADPRTLSATLRALPVFSRMAICDAVERWWREQGKGE